MTLFGESHGPGIGVTLDGIPAGTPITTEMIQKRLDQRKPGTDVIHSQRKESDIPILFSGIRDGRATGAPVTVLIENEDDRSTHYRERKDTPRPGHADFTSWLKYGEDRDWRGGGHFSGRLTAPIVAAGAIADQLIGDMECISYTRKISDLEIERSPEEIRREQIQKPIFCPESEKAERMEERIDEARQSRNSLGGVIETVIRNVPGGMGEVFFGRVDARLSYFCMAIPAVKGIEFGTGFDAAEMTGKEHNDPLEVEGGEIRSRTNHAGGVLGGVTTGMPVVFRTVVKPTSSIPQEQQTVNVKTKEETDVLVKGRHDPCVVPRAVPVLRACAEIVMADFLMR